MNALALIVPVFNPLEISENAIVAGWLNVFESLVLAFCFARFARLMHHLIKAPYTGHKDYNRVMRDFFAVVSAWQFYSAFQTYAMDAAVATHTRLWLRFAVKAPVLIVAIRALAHIARAEVDMIRTLQVSEYSYAEQKITQKSARRLRLALERIVSQKIQRLLHRLKGGDHGASRAGVGGS